MDPGSAQRPQARIARMMRATREERAARAAGEARREAVRTAQATRTRRAREGASAARAAKAAHTGAQALREALSNEGLGVRLPKPFAERKGGLSWPIKAGWNDARHVLGRPRAQARVRTGATVKSVGAGRVAWTGPVGGTRRGVILTHGAGWMSIYIGVEASASEGEWVGEGEPLGETQTQGRADGTTLVGVEIVKDARAQDPFEWMREEPGATSTAGAWRSQPR